MISGTLSILCKWSLQYKKKGEIKLSIYELQWALIIKISGERSLLRNAEPSTTVTSQQKYKQITIFVLVQCSFTWPNKLYSYSVDLHVVCRNLSARHVMIITKHRHLILFWFSASQFSSYAFILILSSQALHYRSNVRILHFTLSCHIHGTSLRSREVYNN